MVTFLKKIVGDTPERAAEKLRGQLVPLVNELEDSVRSLDDSGLRAKTDEFRSRLDDGESLDDLLPEAFAVVREAARRQLGQRHYDVQLIGGAVLHHGKIAEMKTGEGKTLVATLPAYLNARLRRVTAFTWLPSTTTWPAATRYGWGRCITCWASPWAASSTTPPTSTTPNWWTLDGAGSST